MKDGSVEKIFFSWCPFSVSKGWEVVTVSSIPKVLMSGRLERGKVKLVFVVNSELKVYEGPRSLYGPDPGPGPVRSAF